MPGKFNIQYVLIVAASIFIGSCSSTDDVKTIATILSDDKSQILVIKSIIPGSILDPHIEINIYSISDKLRKNKLQSAYVNECKRVFIEFNKRNITILLNDGGVAPFFRENLENDEKFEWNISNNIDSDLVIKSKLPLNQNQLYIDDCEKYMDPDEYNRKQKLR